MIWITIETPIMIPIKISMFFIGLYWTPAVLFGVMILVLLVRPTGLFGKR